MTVQFGYIFYWDGGREAGEADDLLTLFLSHLGPSASFRKGRRSRSNRWYSLWYVSKFPLLGEERGGLLPDANFEYAVRLRVNNRTGTIIVASQRYSITDAAVSAINFSLNPNLRRKVVNVEEVSEHLLGKEAQNFAITFYMADIPGYGTALSSITLRGDDIAAADFLTTERAGFTARQIGVRPLTERAECGRFGNSGTVQFRDENVEMFEKFLSYAYDLGMFID